MTTPITSTHATTLGPFLTLPGLTASRETNVSGDRLATVEAADGEISGQQPEFGDALTRGRFLALILTVHSRRGSDSGAWLRSFANWQAAPFVTIPASE